MEARLATRSVTNGRKRWMPYDNEGGNKAEPWPCSATWTQRHRHLLVHDNPHSCVPTARGGNAGSLLFEWERVTSGFMFNLKQELNQVKRIMAYECLLWCGDFRHKLTTTALLASPSSSSSTFPLSFWWRGISTRLSAHLHPSRDQKASPETLW